VVCWCLVGCVAHTGINTKGAGVVILSTESELEWFIAPQNTPDNMSCGK